MKGFINMKEYQKRVKQELSELNKKITSLVAFIESPEFCGSLDSTLLEIQLSYMKNYSVTLGLRVSGFEAKMMTGGDGPSKPPGGG